MLQTTNTNLKKLEEYLNIAKQDSFSVEAGLGLYANKDIDISKDSKLKLYNGVAFYKEFADALNLADKAYVLDIGEDRIEVGYEDVNAYWIIDELKNGEHIGMDEPEKLLKYENSVLIFMSSKDIYVLANKYKEIA